MTTHITKTWFEDGKLITEVIPKSEIYNREWVGLTAEDWIIGKRSADYIAGAEWAEAKLKEKNSD